MLNYITALRGEQWGATKRRGVEKKGWLHISSRIADFGPFRYKMKMGERCKTYLSFARMQTTRHSSVLTRKGLTDTNYCISHTTESR
jgi:hypothetical protein